MIKLKYEVTENNRAIFSAEDELWTARAAAYQVVMKLLKEQLIVRLKPTIALKDIAVMNKNQTWLDNVVKSSVEVHFADQLCGDRQKLCEAKVGDSGISTLASLSVTWECTLSGRAPARPKNVIAAERAAQAAKRQKKTEQNEKYRADADQRTINLRNRIKTQVDHAFTTGKSGTEPASKYITCQHCDAPAAVLCLNQPLARGASVLDEDTIVGALCIPHIKHGVYGYQSSHSAADVVGVPCSKLEFFYDGVRQIAIKP
jgi:hypothetical protein